MNDDTLLDNQHFNGIIIRWEQVWINDRQGIGLVLSVLQYFLVTSLSPVMHFQ